MNTYSEVMHLLKEEAVLASGAQININHSQA